MSKTRPHLSSVAKSKPIHTKESIVSKLDTDLTDQERKSFLTILMSSADTLPLVHLAALTWEKDLHLREIPILNSNELIRCYNIFLDGYKKSPLRDPAKDMIRTKGMQEALDRETKKLEMLTTSLEASKLRAVKTLFMSEPILKEKMKELEGNIENLNHSALTRAFKK